MAEVALTQEEKHTLRADPRYRTYFLESIIDDETGGVGFLLRLESFTDQVQALAWVVARAIRKTPSIVSSDPTLLDFIDIQILVRDIDKKEDSVPGELLDQVKAYLSTANRINLLVGDYLAHLGASY